MNHLIKLKALKKKINKKIINKLIIIYLYKNNYKLFINYLSLIKNNKNILFILDNHIRFKKVL